MTRKTKTAMKQTRILMSIAALAIVGAMTGCSKINQEQQTVQDTAQKDNIVKVTSSVKLETPPGSRVTDENGARTFVEGEQIAIYYENTSNTLVRVFSNALAATDIADGGRSATFSATLTNPKPNGTLKYKYPVGYAQPNGQWHSNGDIHGGFLDKQWGTLSSIQPRLITEYSGHLTAQATLPASVKMQNLMALCKLTIKNESSEDITNTITALSINDGVYNYYVINDGNLIGSTIWVVMTPFTGRDITFHATDGTNYYSKTVTGKTLEAGHLYPISVKMAENIDINLDLLAGNYTVTDGTSLTGTLDEYRKVSIQDGATVTLNGVHINDNKKIGDSAGLTCLGDATIVLADGSTNTVKGFYSGHPGIYIEAGKTLTIQGTGTLTATSYGAHGSGIGAGNSSCGNIVINSGTIIAVGGNSAAGIGAGYASTCGDITINGGTITTSSGEAGIGSGATSTSSCGKITINGGIIHATGGQYAAGIGCGYQGDCGNILITGGEITATGGEHSVGIGSGAYGTSHCSSISIYNTVTRVTATKGYQADNSIGYGGPSGPDKGTCGPVTIGGVVYWNGSAYTNGGDTYLTSTSIVYP